MTETPARDDLLGLADKAVLVVGGGSGIGRATALLLARVGARVGVVDLEHDRAEAVAAEIRAHGARALALTADVTDPAEVERFVARAHAEFGHLHGLVDIVGAASWGDLLSVDLETWDGDLRLNLTQHMLVGREVAARMINDGVAGAIALVTSVSGIYGAPNHAAYGAAKAGAAALARSMANEWGPYGIRVNSVAPDIIATPRVVSGFAQRGIGARAEMDRVVQADGVLLGRWGEPEEIAGPLVFLLSDLAGFVTGQDLVIDGGMQARFPHGGPKPFSED